ncbi:MAG: hydrogenase 3 membrane subunit, partial [Chloroflexota bacterium]
MNPFWLVGIGLLQAVLLLLLAPLFSGFARVMRAKMHSRKGPPLL